jgi:hypothetical protein
MRISIRYALVSCAFGMLLACTHAGDRHPSPDQGAAAAPAGACGPGQNCPPAATTVPASTPIKPAVPAVPDSPIKANCAKLPTQVERDTCTNRKESTG